ncbi:hypothetical protein J6590_083158 [Homalodisca vitripennis]|nr:hypothetical protein J6590_083158 [Homalodisca vitripennis]
MNRTTFTDHSQSKNGVRTSSDFFDVLEIYNRTTAGFSASQIQGVRSPRTFSKDQREPPLRGYRYLPYDGRECNKEQGKFFQRRLPDASLHCTCKDYTSMAISWSKTMSISLCHLSFTFVHQTGVSGAQETVLQCLLLSLPELDRFKT